MAKDSEYLLQKSLIHYLTFSYPKVLYCASAGGVRTSMRQAIKMKATGYKKGFPDLFIYEAKNGFNGFALEVKTLKGVASPEQKKWRDDLISRGYSAHICKGLDECIKAIDEYLDGNN